MILPAHLQAVIDAYRDGLNERETALLLGISRHKVRTRRAQARALLRSHFRSLVPDGAGI